MIFYPASAYRRPATHNDIIQNKTFTSYKEAKAFVLNYGHDSCDVVFVNINDEWLMAWGYDKQNRLLVCKENEGWCDAIPLEQYLEQKGRDSIELTNPAPNPTHSNCPNINTNNKNTNIKGDLTMFAINTIVRPLSTADSEYSVCGNSVLYKAKVIDTFTRKANGNNIKIEILEHANPDEIGKKYKVDDRFFEAIEMDWIWVDAYKGTDANMCCKDKQYVMGVEDVYGDKVVLGCKGYHVCTDLKHCFKTYDYNFSNRFFEVQALVNANAYEYRNPNNTTLVAKAIRFVEEITNDYETIEAKRASMN